MIINPLIPCLWPFQPTAMSVLVDHDNSRTDLNFQDVSINSFLIFLYGINKFEKEQTTVYKFTVVIANEVAYG